MTRKEILKRLEEQSYIMGPDLPANEAIKELLKEGKIRQATMKEVSCNEEYTYVLAEKL